MRLVLGSAVAIAAVGLVGFVGISSSQADEAALKPTVIGDGEFYTYDQLADAWQSAVAEFPEELADGAEISSSLPRFFDDVDKEGLFETNLVDSLVADLWQCSWLDVVVSEQSDTAVSNEAKEELDKWSELPAVEGFDAEGYEQSMTLLAAEEGKTFEQLEFAFNCNGYEGDLS